MRYIEMRIHICVIHTISTELFEILFVKKNNLIIDNEDQNSHNIIIVTFWHRASVSYKTDGMTPTDSRR